MSLPSDHNSPIAPGSVVLIAGGSGFIGTRLSEVLDAAGYRVIHLSRRPDRSARWPSFAWDPSKGYIDERALSQAAVIINLAAAGLADKRWTPQRRDLILSSRVEGASTFAQYLKTGRFPATLYISASAIGYYGDKGESWCTEEMPPGKGFMAEVCRQWEAAAATVAAVGIRTVIFRIGIVFSDNGGALAPIFRTLRLGIRPYFGGGNQYWSWIDIEDVCGIMRFALENPQMRGVYNASAPEPATSYAIAVAMKRASRGLSIALPAPSFALALGLGKMSAALTDSIRTSANKLIQSGYRFRHTDLGDVLRRHFH